MRSAAGFQLVITPSRSLVRIASSDDSTMAASRASATGSQRRSCFARGGRGGEAHGDDSALVRGGEAHVVAELGDQWDANSESGVRRVRGHADSLVDRK